MTNLEMLKNTLKKAQDEGLTYNILQGVKMDKTGVVLIHNENAYKIDVIDGKVQSCTCPHHKYRNAVCKHMVVVAERLNTDISILG